MDGDTLIDDAGRLIVEDIDEPPKRTKTLLRKHAVNLAAGLDEDYLDRLGERLYSGVQTDDAQRSPWARSRANIRKFFACVREQMTWPIEGIPKMAVPIVNVGVSQFTARAAPDLMPPKGFANILPTGQEDHPRALRVEKVLNAYLRKLRRYQEGMERMLATVALDGICIRKLYYDDDARKLIAQTCPAAEVIPSYTPSGDIRDCVRVTHLTYMSIDTMQEEAEEKRFLSRVVDELGPAEHEYDELGHAIRGAARGIEGVTEGATEVAPAETSEGEIAESDRPRLVLEVHTKIRLPGDSDLHPVIVWLDAETQKVLRIVSRQYEVMDGEKRQKREFWCFVKYGFSPNPDGFYDHGLGTLLESYNAMANVLANVLMVAGIWRSTLTGLVSERTDMTKEDIVVRPGKLTKVDLSVDELSKAVHIFEFPGADQVLFAMLGSVQQWGKEVASVNDMNQGLQQPSQQTATTTITLVEQGLKIYAAAHARIRSAYREELEITVELLRIFMPNEEYNAILGDDGSDEYKAWREKRAALDQLEAAASQMRGEGMEPPELPPGLEVALLPFSIEDDLAPGYDIIPMADPEVTSAAQRLLQAKEVYTTLAQNPFTGQDIGIMREALKRLFHALSVPNPEPLLPTLPPPPAPPPNLDQYIEDAMFLAGDLSPQVLPGQAHGEHLIKMAEFDQGPAKMLTPEAKAAREQHRAKHAAGIWLAEKGLNEDGSPKAVAPAQPPMPGNAGPPQPGGDAGMGQPPMHDVLPQGPGPGEAADNASPQLRGRFPSLGEYD